MTDNSRAKTILELTVATSIDANDRIIVHDVSANTTKQATRTLLQQSLFNGPYANDTVANTAGVALGEPYYNANGAVYVRLV
jgi:hypothetical protein